MRSARREERRDARRDARRTERRLARALAAALPLVAAALIAACGGEREPDAYGTFEATEVVVSAETGGQVRSFAPVEGARLERGAVVAVVDTTDLALERRQLVAQRAAVGARRAELTEQLRVLAVQRDVARRAYERTRRLYDARAATAQQLDQAEGDYRVLGAQMDALRAQQRSVGLEVTANEARVEQIGERLTKSTVTNPRAGTVLATYTRAGEVVQPGQPLYRIADLDTLELRAYVTGAQLARVRLGNRVQVNVDRGARDLLTLPGTVTWISPSAEFTPTPIQTRDERVDLVYAVKIRVPNPDGALKIGMPGDVTLGAPAGGAPADSMPVERVSAERVSAEHESAERASAGRARP
ncbi:MAG TPA: HlyD family efflux transporter periplasmic adaptor subunit [Gemmatimonadaceae bacterium]|nr:HlyD family efflux transporter periplasmic adaptor subunit [Gemmatimonadaceae bacterium]